MSRYLKTWLRVMPIIIRFWKCVFLFEWLYTLVIFKAFYSMMFGVRQVTMLESYNGLHLQIVIWMEICFICTHVTFYFYLKVRQSVYWTIGVSAWEIYHTRSVYLRNCNFFLWSPNGWFGMLESSIFNSDYFLLFIQLFSTITELFWN